MNVIEAAAVRFDLAPQQITGPRRLRPIAIARFAAAYVLRERFRLSYPIIARMLNRDNSTAMYAVRNAANLISRDAAYASAVADLMVARIDELPPELYSSPLVHHRWRVGQEMEARRKAKATPEVKPDLVKSIGANAGYAAKQSFGSRCLAEAMLRLAA